MPANFGSGEALEIHYEKLDENDGKLRLPFEKSSMVTGIDGGHVMGAENHPSWNIIQKRVKGNGKFYSIRKNFGYIETEKFGDLVTNRVSRNIIK